MSTRKPVPRCSRCRNHGLTAARRGHSGKCPYQECTCWKCALVTERTRIMSHQRRVWRTTSPESAHPGPIERQAEPAGRPEEPAAYRRSPESAGETERVLISAQPHGPYSAEMLPLPLPYLLFYHHANGFVYPVVRAQHPPSGPPPGEAIGFPPLLPNVLPYPAEPRQPQEGPVSFYAPYPPYPSVLEDCDARPHHYILFNRMDDNRTPSHTGSDPEVIQGSQGLDASRGQ